MRVRSLPWTNLDHVLAMPVVSGTYHSPPSPPSKLSSSLCRLQHHYDPQRVVRRVHVGPKVVSHIRFERTGISLRHSLPATTQVRDDCSRHTWCRCIGDIEGSRLLQNPPDAPIMSSQKVCKATMLVTG
jgi:hypothetical protein